MIHCHYTHTHVCVWCATLVEMAVGGFDFLMWFKLMDEQEIWGRRVDVCVCVVQFEKTVAV